MSDGAKEDGLPLIGKDIPASVLSDAEQVLGDGELINWAWQPDPGYIRRQMGGLWLFFVPWTAFALFAVVGGYRQDGLFSMVVFMGVLFALLGLFFLTRPARFAAEARRSIHVLTNRRLFTLETGTASKPTSYDLADIESISNFENRAGLGGVMFYTRKHVTQQHRVDGFPNAEEVERRLRKCIRERA
jgi:hypothetical protein